MASKVNTEDFLKHLPPLNEEYEINQFFDDGGQSNIFYCTRKVD